MGRVSTLVLRLVILTILSRLTESAIGEHDLAFRGTGCQKFDRLSRLNQREGGLNQGIDLLCRKERENPGQVLAQRLWVLPVQHRDAVELAHAPAQARANENIREHGQLGKFRRCAHETEADQGPAPECAYQRLVLAPPTASNA